MSLQSTTHKRMAESAETPRPRVLTLTKQGSQTDSWSPTKTRPSGAVTPIKKGPLRVDQYGETSYKKTPSDILRQSIQLGLQVAIGSLAPKARRDLLMTDFEVVESVNFPADGSDHSPAHKFPDFKFNTYSPSAFRFFRLAFGIQPDDFMLGLCDQSLTELSNSGASGSLFYISGNDEFIIKTVQKKETEFLQKLLPGYYLNLTQNKHTLLPKFFGLFKYQSGRTNIRIVVMNNLLPRNYTYHEKFDLKGSTYKRQSSSEERAKKHPTFKDLDLMQMHPEGFTVMPEHYEAIRDTITRDIKVLESFSIMDYSLLLAVHYMQEGRGGDLEASMDQSLTLDSLQGPPHQGAEAEANVRRRRATFSILYRDGPRNPVVRRRDTEEREEEQQPERQESDTVLLGGIPARTADGRKVLLFMGIIDILQSYRLKKKLEHTIKAVYADGATVSVCNPHFYAQRFVDFMMNTVFKKGKMKAKPRRLSVQKTSRRPLASSTLPLTATLSSPPSHPEGVVHTQERRQRSLEDHHDSVPPTYREVLEKDQRDKLRQSIADASSESAGDSEDAKGEPAGKSGAESVQRGGESSEAAQEGERRDDEAVVGEDGGGQHTFEDLERAEEGHEGEVDTNQVVLEVSESDPVQPMKDIEPTSEEDTSAGPTGEGLREEPAVERKEGEEGGGGVDVGVEQLEMKGDESMSEGDVAAGDGGLDENLEGKELDTRDK